MPRPAKTAAPKAQPGEISANAAAERLELTAASISQWAMKPGAPVRKEGTRVWVRYREFARWREQEMVRQAKAEASSAGDLDQARTRKANAEAELAELEVGKARGEWVSVADYETALGRMLDHVMARLRALPIRLAHLGPEVEAAAETEVERVVNEMAGFDEDVIEEPPPEQEKAA